MPRSLFRSGVLVRVGHTLLTWVTTLVLFLHDTGTFERKVLDLYFRIKEYDRLLSPDEVLVYVRQLVSP